ncbi:hypothetical protein MHI32_30210 [Paenibacillus sp. FSL H7-0690]|jgi:restriction system protein
MSSFIGFIVVIIVLSILTGMKQATKKKRGRSTASGNLLLRKAITKA